MSNRSDEVYTSIKIKDIVVLFIFGGLIGAVIFTGCYGFSVLDVTNDGWLLAGTDLSQHYLGWKFYRNSPWHFPVGMIDGLVYPHQSCVIYTDSIPLLAIFFKLLSPVLPETFQYFGIWGLMTFWLMGGLSAVIIRKSTKNIYLCLTGSVFFSFSPYVFQRLFNHSALAANWILLAAIGIWLYKPFFNNFKRKILAWGSLLIVGSLIHIYYIPMIMIFMSCSFLEDCLLNRGWKSDLIIMPLLILCDLAVLSCVGAFEVTGSMEGTGLGLYSANLNTFWNPLNYSALFDERPFNPGQEEGFGYLGLGMLVLLGISVCVLIISGLKSRNTRRSEQAFCRFFIKSYSFQICMLIAAFIYFALAICPVIVFNTTEIISIKYPEGIYKFLSIFRASGRFIWCVCYILMFFAVMNLLKRVKKSAVFAILIIALILQITDLSEVALSRRKITEDYSRKKYFTSEQWRDVFENKKHLVYVPCDLIEQTLGPRALYELSSMALENDMTVNYFIAARVDVEAIRAETEAMCAAMENGESGNKDTIYILDSEETGKKLGLSTCIIDETVVGTAQSNTPQQATGHDLDSF